MLLVVRSFIFYLFLQPWFSRGRGLYSVNVIFDTNTQFAYPLKMGKGEKDVTNLEKAGEGGCCFEGARDSIVDYRA